MVTPKTYVGYDADGNKIIIQPAADANETLNPNEVKAALDNLEKVLDEQMENVAKSLEEIAPNAGAALVVKGTNMKGTVEDIAKEIRQIADKIFATVSDIYDRSITVHDQIQSQYNSKAYDVASQGQNVVRVKEG